MAFKFYNNIKQNLSMLKEFLPLVNYQNSLPEAIPSVGKYWKETQKVGFKITNAVLILKYLRLLCNLQCACNSLQPRIAKMITLFLSFCIPAVSNPFNPPAKWRAPNAE